MEALDFLGGLVCILIQGAYSATCMYARRSRRCVCHSNISVSKSVHLREVEKYLSV